MFLRASVIGLIGSCVWCTVSDSSPVITAVTLEPSKVSKNASVVTLVCEIKPYTKVMKWYIQSNMAADCILSFCKKYVLGRYSYELDTDDGVFNLTINPVTFDDNGIYFGCWDGTTRTSLLFTVVENELSKPLWKPTEDKKSSQDLTLIIILVAVIIFLAQLAVMCFLQLKIHDIQIKAKGKDTEVNKRIITTILGSIPILGLIPIYFTSRVFYKEVYHGPRTTSNEFYVVMMHAVHVWQMFYSKRYLPRSHENSGSSMPFGFSAVTFPGEKDDLTSCPLHQQHPTEEHRNHNEYVHNNNDGHYDNYGGHPNHDVHPRDDRHQYDLC